MDLPNLTPAQLYDLQSIQQAVQDGSDIGPEAERRRCEIGFPIDQYPPQTTGQPYNS